MGMAGIVGLKSKKKTTRADKVLTTGLVDAIGILLVCVRLIRGFQHRAKSVAYASTGMRTRRYFSRFGDTDNVKDGECTKNYRQ